MDIYVIIDAQNDFIDEALGSAQAQITVPKICKTLWKVDPDKSFVIFTRDTHFHNYLNTSEGKNLPILHCQEDSYGWEINKEIFDSTTNIPTLIINKTTFGTNKIVDRLKMLFCYGRFDSITIMGFTTDICVISNALILKTAFPETPIKVLANCCAGTTPERHKEALDIMRSCQIEVIE